MSTYTSADLSVTGVARIASDGKRILCDKRNQCSGVLGEVGVCSADYQDEHIEETLIVLPGGVASQKNGVWRKTKRPGWRGENAFARIGGKTFKFTEKPASFWGTKQTRLSDYVLPVPVVCPRCKRVNLITDALLPRP
jgi:hypothetical protein